MIKKRHLSLLIKLLVASVFVVVIVNFVDLEQISELIQHTDGIQVFIALLIVLVIRGLMALRWKLVLDAHAAPISYVESLYIILVSGAFGFFSPGGVAADFLKGHHVYQQEKSLSRIAAVVFFDKIIGVFSMLLIVAVFSVILYLGESGGDSELVALVAMFSCLFVAVSVIGIFLLFKFERVSNRVFTVLPQNVNTIVGKVYRVSLEMAANKVLMLQVIVISIVMQVLRSVMFYFILKSLMLNVSLISVIAYFPLVFMLMLLPITVGGIGVREGATFVLFEQFGVSLEHSVGSGIVFYGVQLCIAVLGFMVYILFSSKVGRSTLDRGQT